MPGHLPLAARILQASFPGAGPHRPRGQLQGCGVGWAGHGEERGSEMSDRKQLRSRSWCPPGSSSGAPQQHGYHAGKELLAPSPPVAATPLPPGETEPSAAPGDPTATTPVPQAWRPSSPLALALPGRLCLGEG